MDRRPLSVSGFELGHLQRRRAALLGAAGEAWVDGLPALIADLEARWRIRVERSLTGGTEALVLAARTRGDLPVVLKLGLPDSLGHEIRALEIAAGRGYAELLEADPENDAVLLEALGEALIDADVPVERKQDIVVRTVGATWHPVHDPRGLVTGAEKARWHLNWLSEQWPALGEPCSRAIIDQALACAAEREDAFEPAASVLVHGDSHAWNTLAVPGSDRDYKLVDPDGYFMEPAYDLGISMREWIEPYLPPDGDRAARRRAARLSAMTGVAEEPIWQWGYIELVSTALVYTQLGEAESAAPYYRAAGRLVGG